MGIEPAGDGKTKLESRRSARRTDMHSWNFQRTRNCPSPFEKFLAQVEKNVPRVMSKLAFNVTQYIEVIEWAARHAYDVLRPNVFNASPPTRRRNEVPDAIEV